MGEFPNSVVDVQKQFCVGGPLFSLLSMEHLLLHGDALVKLHIQSSKIASWISKTASKHKLGFAWMQFVLVQIQARIAQARRLLLYLKTLDYGDFIILLDTIYFLIIVEEFLSACSIQYQKVFCTFFGSDGRKFTIKFNYLQLLIF